MGWNPMGFYLFWDGIETFLFDKKHIEMRVKHIFVIQKNIETKVSYFLSHLHVYDRVRIDKSRPIASHYRLMIRIFSIRMRSRKIPSLLK